jgi:GGDEF domain-containing protein
VYRNQSHFPHSGIGPADRYWQTPVEEALVGAIWARWSRSLRDGGRLVHASVMIVLIALLLTTLNAVNPVLPWVLVWLPGIAGSFLVSIAFGRTARTQPLPAPTRRLWRQLFVVSALVVPGNIFQTIGVLRSADPHGTHIAPLQMAFGAAAIFVVIWALLRLPLGAQSRGQIFRVLLDAGTVMLACALFTWHFSTRFILRGDNPRMIFTSLTLMVLAMVAVFAVAKVMLTGHSWYLDRGAMRMIGLTILASAIGPAFRPLLETVDPHLYPDMVYLPLMYLCATIAAERQRRADYSQARGLAQTRRRAFSMLPYVAIGAVDALMLSVTLPADVADRQVIVVSAVVLTGVVVLRQVHAFRDNGLLLRRLDHNATHDALTQLPNRALFHERLQRALSGHADRPVCVALIDLDDFKIVNDRLGHEIGDRLLIAVAERLSACVRAEDIVARLGGDEFVLILDGTHRPGGRRSDRRTHRGRVRRSRPRRQPRSARPGEHRVRRRPDRRRPEHPATPRRYGHVRRQARHRYRLSALHRADGPAQR